MAARPAHAGQRDVDPVGAQTLLELGLAQLRGPPLELLLERDPGVI